MKKQFVTITVIFVLVFAGALVAMLLSAPWLADWYARLRGFPPVIERCVLISFYICAVPAAVALYCLWRLLWNIRAGQVFVYRNGRLLQVISYCCAAVAIGTLAAAYHYLPFAIVAVAMLFIFLIVRVVYGCLLAGAELREENSLTI